MKITGIDLFYYPPSVFYNYNDDFCLISILCVGESRTENQKPSDLFTDSFCHKITGQRTLYKSGFLLSGKRFGLIDLLNSDSLKQCFMKD